MQLAASRQPRHVTSAPSKAKPIHGEMDLSGCTVPLVLGTWWRHGLEKPCRVALVQQSAEQEGRRVYETFTVSFDLIDAVVSSILQSPIELIFCHAPRKTRDSVVDPQPKPPERITLRPLGRLLVPIRCGCFALVFHFARASVSCHLQQPEYRTEYRMP